jgi:DNA repair exonuclease SbcCD ATPase subunit
MEKDVAVKEEDSQQQPSTSSVGLMNNAFFSNFGETLSQVGNMAKENAEKLKEQIRLSQLQQSAQQERDERQEKGQGKKKNKGDYVRLPIESAKRLRALDTGDINELEILHKAQIGKVLAENEMMKQKLKLLSRTNDEEQDDKMENEEDIVSKKCAEIETATNRVLVIGLQEQVIELEAEVKEIEEDLEVSRENTKKCQHALEDVEANYETCQTQRDALKQELEELKEELLKASSRNEKLEEEKAEMENEMKKKAQKAVENTEEKANASPSMKHLENELKAKEDTIASLRDQLAKMSENIKVSASKKSEQDEMKLKKALEKAQKQKEQFKTKIKTLESRVKEAEETSKKFETLANDAMDCGRQLESEANETSTKQLWKMKEKMNESNETSREYSRRIRELEQELFTARENLQDAKTVANETKIKVETKLATMEQQLKDVKEQKDDFEMQKNEAVSEMEAMRLDMELEFEQRLEQRSDKTKENARLEIERKDLLNSLEFKEKELERYVQSLEDKTNEMDEAKRELSEFKREYSALENHMKKLVSEQKHTNAISSSSSSSPLAPSSRQNEDETSLVASLETALKRAKESKATSMDTVKELKKELETLKIEFDTWRKKARKIMTEKDAECDKLRKLSGVISSRNSSFSSLKSGDGDEASSNRGLDKQEFGYIKAVVLKFLMCDEWMQQEAVLKILVSLFNIDEDPAQLKKIRDARRFLEPTPISTAEVSLAKYSEDSVNYFTNDILGYGDII